MRLRRVGYELSRLAEEDDRLLDIALALRRPRFSGQRARQSRGLLAGEGVLCYRVVQPPRDRPALVLLGGRDDEAVEGVEQLLEGSGDGVPRVYGLSQAMASKMCSVEM